MKQAGWILSLIFTVLIPSFSWAEADSISEGSWSGASWNQRASARESKRWTLQEWLDTRDRNRLMDLWLSLHSPSPYEAVLGAAYKPYLVSVDTNKTEKSYSSVEGSVTAHASLVGLTVGYENNVQEKYNDLAGQFNLRIFGDSIQSSYLTLNYGQRTRTYTGGLTNADFKNQFGQVSLQLYLMKYFGVDAFYRGYLPATNDNLKEEMRGSLTEVGAFIDFKAVRVFGSWFQDEEILKSTSSEVTTLRVGTKAGLQIFF